MINNKKPTILIVDDVPMNIQVLGNLLKNMECQIAVAMNGQQALDTISKFKPDLILLDVMMPVMDGFEVCRRIKSSEETKDIPVIFLTAKTETDDIVEGFNLGAVDYVTKPFIGSELLARVETHISLKRTKEHLKAEVATKNKFLSIISHDLRGSFSIILNLVEMLLENRECLTDDEINEFLDNIGITSKNTFELLENLLEWARSQTGHIRYNPEMIPLDGIVNECIKTLREGANKKEISLVSKVRNDDEVYADCQMTLLVVRNLLSNAIKFTPKGGNITIHTQKVDNNLKISVDDTGVGMEPEKVKNLFNIDKKVSSYGTENEQGTGLGLILCKEFIEYHHKGRITVESELGKGTAISFTLPLNG